MYFEHPTRILIENLIWLWMVLFLYPSQTKFRGVYRNHTVHLFKRLVSSNSSLMDEPIKLYTVAVYIVRMTDVQYTFWGLRMCSIHSEDYVCAVYILRITYVQYTFWGWRMCSIHSDFSSIWISCITQMFNKWCKRCIDFNIYKFIVAFLLCSLCCHNW